MATCEDNNWFWDYFTSVNNIAKCDICYTSFQITEVPKDNIMRHIETKHSVDYQRIVSSENSQEDLESQLYIKHNNDITCKYCDLIFYATDNSYSLLNHLETRHEIKEDIAAIICDWLRKFYFDESDTDMKRRCTSCKKTILNKPLLFLSHLSEVHKINLLLEIKSVWHWVWEYYKRSERHKAECSVCNKDFILYKSYSNIIYHIKQEHGNMSEVSENSQANRIWPYSIIENNKLKCDYCDISYELPFYASTNMKAHLIKAHNLNEYIARKLCNWILEYFYISNLQTSKCNICENMFQTSNSFNLMIHLKEAHQVRVSPEIIPAGLSSELDSLFNTDKCAENNAPSSSCNQSSRNVDQSSDRDNLYDEIDNSSKMQTTRLSSEFSSLLNSDRCAENNAPSSSYNQLPRNVDQSSDCDDLYDQINNPSEIKTTRLSSELSSLLNSDRCAENNAPSISYNQIPRKVDQSSDYDDLYDQINNPSEIKTTRLSSELSSLFNSNRCVENNAPSTSYNQPPRNVDQSSDCDNHYVQIDNCLKIKTKWYKRWRQNRYY